MNKLPSVKEILIFLALQGNKVDYAQCRTHFLGVTEGVDANYMAAWKLRDLFNELDTARYIAVQKGEVVLLEKGQQLAHAYFLDRKPTKAETAAIKRGLL